MGGGGTETRTGAFTEPSLGRDISVTAEGCECPNSRPGLACAEDDKEQKEWHA